MSTFRARREREGPPSASGPRGGCLLTVCPCDLTTRLQTSRERAVRQRQWSRDLHRVTKETGAHVNAMSLAVRARVDAVAAGNPAGAGRAAGSGSAESVRVLLETQLAVSHALLAATFGGARAVRCAAGARQMRVLRQAERSQQRLRALRTRAQLA